MKKLGSQGREGRRRRERTQLGGELLLLLLDGRQCDVLVLCVAACRQQGRASGCCLTCGVVSSAVCQPDSSRGRTHSARLVMEVGS